MYRIALKYDKNTYASEILDNKLEYQVFEHKSVLLRKLGESEMYLQRNKITNLKIASNQISGVLIKPNEVFSVWSLVDEVTYKNGYLDGLYISNNEMTSGVGGGLCQLSNLLFWMFLHTDLEIIERYRHDIDPFQDDGRIIPFGTGATLVDGWHDLKVKNNSNYTYQINIWFDEEYIYGDIRVNNNPSHKYHIIEKNHRFKRKEDGIYRQNEIYQKAVNRHTGLTDEVVHLFSNDCLIKYDLEPDIEVE